MDQHNAPQHRTKSNRADRKTRPLQLREKLLSRSNFAELKARQLLNQKAKTGMLSNKSLADFLNHPLLDRQLLLDTKKMPITLEKITAGYCVVCDRWHLLSVCLRLLNYAEFFAGF